jgi:hypothetical protein
MPIFDDHMERAHHFTIVRHLDGLGQRSIGQANPPPPRASSAYFAESARPNKKRRDHADCSDQLRNGVDPSRFTIPLYQTAAAFDEAEMLAEAVGFEPTVDFPCSIFESSTRVPRLSELDCD